LPWWLRGWWDRDADFGIGAVAGLAGELEGDDAGDVALESKDLKIEHERAWSRRRPGRRRASRSGSGLPRAVGFGALDAAFDFADSVEILGDAARSGGADWLSAC